MSVELISGTWVAGCFWWTPDGRVGVWCGGGSREEAVALFRRWKEHYEWR